MDLLRLSDKWLLRDLKRICELKLISMIQIENCAKLLCATHEYDAKRLRTATVKFIMDNVKEVTTLKGFKDEVRLEDECNGNNQFGSHRLPPSAPPP